ncbi:MAG: chorismate-binding protein [Candidatus Micrarchaeota archaeon]
MEFKSYVSEMPWEDEHLTPPRAYLRVVKRFGRTFNFCLESIFDEKSTSLAKRFSRLSIICCEPLLTIKSKGKECELGGKKEIVEELRAKLKGKFKMRGERFVLGANEDPLYFLKTIIGEIHAETGVSRFSFGPIGYASYDMVRFFEKIPDVAPDKLGVPEMYFVLHRNAVIFDHSSKRLHFVTHVINGEKSGLDELMEAVVKGEEEKLENKKVSEEVESNTNESEFGEMIEKAREYIRAGDVFQVVLSRRIRVKTGRDPISIYFSLREVNPSPYMFYLDYGEFQLFGASPEVQARVEGSKIEMRPIAGTRGRGKTEEEEREISKELLEDEKERAEHTMLVDLCRNDVGRVAKFGSVRVPELFLIEKYSHVQHIVSHVIGTLAEGKDSFDAFRATFPAGTVSGAPKVRAMEIIEELEKEKRGPYAGVVGYFDLKGNMDVCITIRSIIMKGSDAYVQVGAGIVLDSSPKGEWIETNRKANGSIKAILGKELEMANLEKRKL